ncbi:disulfide bond formation protein B [Bacillus canaveralius]|uniref:Probable disulfide formation protein n=1 Tax=Bacillus canaveralius TaxID=1403243 RepID=A0A2N5GFW5_9BACI|nr:disulfide oxidoreductase [Bacillus canaveralius]PLR79647.1 disulfide bond formation protein B [Bacillus canaveralius]PLS00838.1 disulfide bond formation protein B [Bacillus canaveralius]RSK53814.1 disulfide bond formation protein B [Bacillus canaveralius]
MEENKKDYRDTYLFISWAASVIAMFGSLYFSEIRQYEPCVLCWYQRILMYPLTIILAVAVVKKDYKIALYSMVMSGVGASISLYHYSIQKIPFMTDSAVSCGRIPCTGQYINWLGFITIPFLALTAFAIIFVLSLLMWKKNRRQHK